MIAFDRIPHCGSTTAAGINDLGVITGFTCGTANIFGFLREPGIQQTGFQAGIYAITDNRNLYVDGGFYLYGDPTVRLWVYVAGNPSQQWQFIQAPGGFTMLNQGTNQYASEAGGQLVEGQLADMWTVSPAADGYIVENNRTGLFLTDPGV